jgi:hypothetical protein
MLNLRDFNILGLKVNTSSTAKDISMVSGFNSYSQKIEHICRTNKGELPADISLGSDYYAFIFDPVGNKPVIESNLAAYIQSGINTIGRTVVNITYSDDEKIILNVNFTVNNFPKIQNSQCTVEVQLQ